MNPMDMSPFDHIKAIKPSSWLMVITSCEDCPKAGLLVNRVWIEGTGWRRLCRDCERKRRARA